MVKTSPFLILLYLSKQENNLPLISGQIKNISYSDQLYHHSYMYQQSELFLFDNNGNEIKSYDYRERKDYDHTIYGNDSFHLLVKNEVANLDNTRIQKEPDGNYYLEWGPFQFNLKPGKYRAFVIFESMSNYWTDELTKERHSVNIWLGKIQSNAVSFELC
ncbi:MAG: hypothetical protein ACP5N9_03105 [Candidatus Bilamarchaeum sp.]|jgi:hypothetical protein